jgi:hypothetical protein
MEYKHFANEIWGSHDGEDVNCGLLGCDAM